MADRYAVDSSKGGGSGSSRVVPATMPPRTDTADAKERSDVGGGGGAAGAAGPGMRRRSSSKLGGGQVRRRSLQRDFEGLPPEVAALMKSAAGIEEVERRTLQQRVWALVDDPGSSQTAQFVAVYVMLLIGLSCTTFVIETLPVFHRQNSDIWDNIETFCIVNFTLEYVTRLVACPNKLEFLKGVLNAIDLVAIAPYYVERVVVNPDDDDGGSSAVFRVVRLVRVFRVFKISRYLSWVKIFASAMLQSAQPLGMLLFIMAIGTVVFSSAIYYAERGEWSELDGLYIRQDGTASPYQSIPASFWWCIITMTTVGYGDDYPVTVGGKLIAAATSLCGILVLAIPITVISTNFNEEYMKLKKQRETVRARMLLLKQHFKQQKSGLAAINDEIVDLVRRNTRDMMTEMSELVELSREELTAEIQELVRIAYTRRQKMLAEAALTETVKRTPTAESVR